MKYLLTSFTAFTVFLALATALSAQNKDSILGDFEALQDIYTVTNGDNWTNNSGWRSMTPETMGTAYGITVYPSGHEQAGRVRKIELANNNLVNYELDSQGNPILDSDGWYKLIEARELKETIGNLQQLKVLAIQRNKLTGGIPNGFYNLINLEVAALGHNNPSVEEEKWPYPSKSDYIGNKFTGSISPAIGNMASLRKLYLDRNYFFNTKIPAEIGNLINLEHLTLNFSGLNGEIPETIGDLKNLDVLHLQGGGPFRMQGESNVTMNNSFSGNIPSGIGNLINLRVLRLGINLFEGGFPLSFSNLSNLTSLIAGGAGISGPFPNHINNDNSPRLTTLFIPDNNITGAIDPDWNGGNLHVFTIVRNDITGELPLCFTDQSNRNFNTNLKMFTILDNNFEGRFADSLEGWYQPRRITMHNNNFSGPLPSAFPVHVSDDDEQLEALSLSNNQFSGKIPIGFGAMNSWEDFTVKLSNNNLTGYEAGAISPVVLDNSEGYASGLRGMKSFDVSGNELPQSALDQILLDLWVNVDSRLGTEWENWGNRAEVNLENQSTGAIPSNTSKVNAAITGLSLAGWDVIYDGWESDERTVEIPNTPSLLSPSDQSSNVSLTPSFEWEDTGASQYRFELRESNSNEQIITSDQEQTVYTIETELDENREYSWRVRSVTGNTESEWSESRTFTTKEMVSETGGTETGSRVFPASPIQFGPVNNEVNSSINPEFKWSAVVGADYYTLHMSRNSPGGMVIDVSVEDTVYTHPEKLGDNSVHHWRVRAVKDGEPGEWSTIFELQTEDEGQPQMADLVAPEHFTQNVSVTPRLEWTQIDSDLFEIRIIDKVTSETVVTDELSGYYYTLNKPLSEETAYIWQVKNIKDGFEGAWSPRWEFTTGMYDYVVGSPFLLSPNKGVEYESLNPTFEWEGVDADIYVISVSRENPSNAKVLSKTNSDATIIFEEVPETHYTTEESLDPETTYFWRVKAIKNGEEGDWSDTWEFMTPNNQAVSNDPGEMPLQTELMQNYPNPFNPATQIDFSVSAVQEVSLKVYDMAGREVADLVNGIMPAGNHQVTFSGDRLASGIYIYRLITGSQSYTKKMTLLK